MTVILLVNWLNPSHDLTMSDYLAGDLSKTNTKLAHGSNQGISTLMLSANCYRQLGHQELFLEKIEQARRINNSKDQVDLASAIHRIQLGQVEGSPLELLDVLRNAGALDSDARSVAIQSAFASDKLPEARLLLDQWRLKQPGSAQMEYLSAVYVNITGTSTDAESRFIQTIVHHPRHELSWLALADLYSRPPNVRFEQAEAVLTRFVKLFVDNAEAPLRLAQVQRRLGRSDLVTSKVLASNSRTGVLELAKIASDAGDYSLAIERLASAKLVTSSDFDDLTDSAFRATRQGKESLAGQLKHVVSWGATAIALDGDPSTATAIFRFASERTARLRRVQDLTVKRSLFPSNQEVINELNAVDSFSFTPNYPRQSKSSTPSILELSVGLPLYIKHCGTCHGNRGDGAGPAACNLYPYPRNFLYEPMRMVSAINRLATDLDIKRTIRQGQPGTSMPSFKELSDFELNSIITTVRWFQVVGLKQQYAKNADTDIDETNALQSAWVKARSQPSEPLVVPKLEFKPRSIESGRVLFRASKCASCHTTNDVGNEGPEKTLTNLFDSLGRRMHPPNLSIDPLHGGIEAEEIYKRIALGIPGTPHPALVGTHEEISTLVAYILSLRSDMNDVTTNHQRRMSAFETR